MRARRFQVGAVPALAQRVTFVGEFGCELYAPTEYMLTLWDSLVASGAPLYIPSTVDAGTPVEVGVFGAWCAATVRVEPLFDPGNARVRG